jgi:hypothetical protein
MDVPIKFVAAEAGFFAPSLFMLFADMLKQCGASNCIKRLQISQIPAGSYPVLIGIRACPGIGGTTVRDGAIN